MGMMIQESKPVKIDTPVSIVLGIFMPATCTKLSSEIIEILLNRHTHSFNIGNNGRDLTRIPCTRRTRFDPHQLI